MMEEHHEPTMTIAICTYNRADLLHGAIESLCQQSCDSSLYQILVIDNASTDHTQEVITACEKEFPAHSISWLYEKQLGLSHARNLAWRSIFTPWIGYLDDDARAAPDYIEKAVALLMSPIPYLCIGGPIYPFYTTDRPVWFKDIYETHLWGEQARLLSRGESLSGSNMIWQKQSLERMGGFNEKLGVHGDRLSVGEETDVFKRLWQSVDQPRFYYSPDLIVYHWVPAEKMKVGYQIKRFFVIGQEAARLDRQPGFYWRFRTLVRSAGAIFFRSLRALLRRFRYRYWQNWVIEEGKPIISKVGLAAALLGFRSDVLQRER